MITYEEILSNDSILRGMCHHAEETNANNNYPVVIVHGYFSANKIGPQRLFVNIANRLAQMGYNVYRFDLSGMGESDGEISDIKFPDHVRDIDSVIKYVQNKHNRRKVIVIAHCLGCNITLSQVISTPDVFREVIFLAPFYSNRLIMERFFGEKQLNELTTAKHTYRKGLYSDYSFFAENTQNDFIMKINATPITINVILPMDDQFIPLECNEETFGRSAKIKLVHLQKADHNFLETQEELISTIMELLSDEKFTV